ncbi:hypothetical protein [Paenibacillus sp.]|uniref:hypothetical protein n=1 Tax=Paenibacillus sp. TaxID=58172 RepID=UPI003464474F
MNKRLTDRERKALKRWIDNPESKPEELADADLSTLIGWAFESEQAAWEEVERLKEGITDAISIWEWMDMDDDLVDIAEKIVEKLRETLPSILTLQGQGGTGDE